VSNGLQDEIDDITRLFNEAADRSGIILDSVSGDPKSSRHDVLELCALDEKVCPLQDKTGPHGYL
jgi:hypothetical protein